MYGDSRENDTYRTDIEFNHDAFSTQPDSETHGMAEILASVHSQGEASFDKDLHVPTPSNL
jgi:hypothetical protein